MQGRGRILGRLVPQGLCCPTWEDTLGTVCSDVWGPGQDLLSDSYAIKHLCHQNTDHGPISPVGTNQCSVECQGQEGT